jgi:two-component system sensor histidine kinase DesK
VIRWTMAYGTLALGAVLVLLLGTPRSWLLVSALTVISALRPWWESGVVTVATVAAVSAAGSPMDNAVVLVAAAAATWFAVALADANAALQAAHDRIDELVAARERSRMSRDLHDILGHSLTTIAVKSGLARQLLDAGAVPRAAVEVADVERLAQQAIGDVRSTVAGSRETTLAGELAAARETLRAAGITGDLPTAVESVRPDLGPAFAHVLREGITNVVRHSAATHVTVRLEPDAISLCNDGPDVDAVSEGAGLRGLRERLATSGATLEHGPTTGGGYRLTARAPTSTP